MQSGSGFGGHVNTIGWMNRSAEIALVASCREWVRHLDDAGSRSFVDLSDSLLPAAFKGSAGRADASPSAAPRNDAGASTELVFGAGVDDSLDDDLPF